MDFRPVFDVPSKLSELSASRSKEYHRMWSDLDRDLRNIDDYYSKLHLQPCPLFFDAERYHELKRLAGQLHGIVETVVQMYMNGNEELQDLFAEYILYRPLMIRQLEHFQVYGRYDVMIDSAGQVKFLETNSAMPGGFIPVAKVNSLFANRVPEWFDIPACQGEIPDANASLGGSILRMMRKFTAEPGAIAILTDENEKFNEINFIRDALESVDLTVVVGRVDNLIYHDGYRLSPDGPAITASYNKMRLFGSKHHWASISYSRNHRFLEAVSRNAMLQINNVACMTIIEDKAFFAALRLPSVRAALSESDNAFIEAHAPASFLLNRNSVDAEGNLVLDDVVSNRGEWIVKPRNDYQGLGAHSGRDYSQDDWTALISSIVEGEVAYLAQCRVDPFLFPVATCRPDGSVTTESVRFAGGIYYRNGEISNILARVSTAEIANISSGKAFFIPVVLAADAA